MVTVLATIAALLPTYLVRFELFGIPSTLLEVLIWLVFVVGLTRFDIATRRRLFERRLWLLPALLLFLGATIGLAVSPDFQTALGLWKGFILDPILVYLLALAFVATPVDRDRIILGLVSGSTIVAGWAIIEAGFIPSEVEGRFLGPYGLEADASPNYLAFAVAPLLPLVIHLTKSRWWQLAISALSIAALVASGSRAGLLAGLGGLTLAVILASDRFWRSKLARWTLIAGLLVLCLGSWFVVRPDFNLSPEAGGRTTASTNVRWQLWSATGELTQAHWLLGVGLGNFQRAFDGLTRDRVNYSAFITPDARTPHNLAVSFWMDATLLGLIAYFAVLVLVGRVLFAALRQSSGRPVAAALVGSWFVLIAHGLLDMPVWKNDGMVLWWLLVALAATVERKTQNAKGKAQPKTA